ncbi:MAG: pyridoxal-phosphate dependent enzyme, partial [Acidimicrobiia bacterium]
MRSSAVYAHLWGTDELRAVFDDDGRLQAWLDILAALAGAQAEAGIIPPEAAAEIAGASRLDQLDRDFLVAETRATSHSTLGLIRAVQRVLPAEAGEWYCFGATVQDVADTWVALAMGTVASVLERDLGAIRHSLVRLAAAHRDTPQTGRTHGQTGLPVTFGFKAAVWADEVGRHLERLRQGQARWLVGQLGGAAGTGSFWGTAAPALLESFCARLGLGVPAVPWVSARDRLGEFAAVASLAVHTLAKVGNEVLELARPEIGELDEPFTPGQVGSITMPHKRNPERAEHLGTLARLVRADLSVLMESTIVEHERDGRAWKAEWAALPDLCLAAGAACATARTLVDGLVVDTDAMAANLAADSYLRSEAVMRALAAKVGKQRAHLIVYEASMAGRDAGVDFRAALLASHDVTAALGADELDAALDPAADTGSAGAYVDRVVRRSGSLATRAGVARQRLAFLPTPLHPSPALSAELGIEVWLKRDDLTGFGLGGNKVRILEYLLGDAVARGADVLVTGGGPGSNYVALAAAGAARLGLGCVAVLYGDPPKSEPANLMLARRAGAEIRFTGDPDRASVDAGVAAASDELAAGGARPYAAGRGGAVPVGCLGYVDAAFELAAQLGEARVRPGHVVVATGSCGTQAGLLLGSALAGGGWEITGVTVSRTVPECVERIAALASGAADLLGVSVEVGVPVVVDGIGPGYGVPSPAGDAAAALAARTEGLVFDPTFTAKGFAGLMAETAAGRITGPVVFLHTGGAGGLLGGT